MLLLPEPPYNQDTFARYAVGSGRHVLWHRMVTEVPELIGRSPDAVRSRWLHLTGRLRHSDQRSHHHRHNHPTTTAASATATAVAEAVETRTEGAPDLATFYLQPPLLKEWIELPEGGFEGSVQGLGGVADGVTLRTREVEPEGEPTVRTSARRFVHILLLPVDVAI